MIGLGTGSILLRDDAEAQCMERDLTRCTLEHDPDACCVCLCIHISSPQT